jgi:nitroreductase
MLSKIVVIMKKLLFIVAAYAATCCGGRAQDVTLPAPQKSGGKPLMEALALRRTERDYSAKELDNQTLSNLLWATCGYNRADKRTAPTARDKQEYVVYVFLSGGTYIYDAKENLLKLAVDKDLRAATGKQDFVGGAAVNLAFVYDKNRMDDSKYAYIDCGYMAQNVYLFCASAGLGTVSRGYFDAEALKRQLALPPNMEIVLTQSVGYPK